MATNTTSTVPASPAKARGPKYTSPTRTKCPVRNSRSMKRSLQVLSAIRRRPPTAKERGVLAYLSIPLTREGGGR